jgi:hypothetical protein
MLTRKPLQSVMPSPWLTLLGDPDFRMLGNTVTLAASAWPSANRGFFLPHRQLIDAYLISVQWRSGSTTGNADAAIYDSAATPNRLASRGAAANVNATATWTLAPPLLMRAGRLYFVALVSSSTTPSFVRGNNTIIAMRSIGAFSQDSVGTLPATATPAQYASAYCPAILLNFAAP